MEIFNTKSQLISHSGFNVKGKYNSTSPVEKKYTYGETQTTVDAGATDQAKYIETIELQNQKLNEIAWIQSHIVRTPLARILGLIEIFGDFKEKEDILRVLEYISMSANELEEAIREIINKSAPLIIA